MFSFQLFFSQKLGVIFQRIHHWPQKLPHGGGGGTRVTQKNNRGQVSVCRWLRHAALHPPWLGPIRAALRDTLATRLDDEIFDGSSCGPGSSGRGGDGQSSASAGAPGQRQRGRGRQERQASDQLHQVHAGEHGQQMHG